MSAGVLRSPGSATTRGSPVNSLHSSPDSSGTAGSPTSPSPRRAVLAKVQQQPGGGQRNHYGPLWFVQITSNHNSTGHAAVSTAHRSALAVKGVGPPSPVCTQSPSPMCERSERSERSERPWPGQAGLTPTAPPRDARDPRDPRPTHVSGRLKRRTLQLLTLDRSRPGSGGGGGGSGATLGATLSGAGYGAVHYKPQAAGTPVPPPPRAERRSPSTSSSTSGATANVHRGKQHRRADAAPGLDGAHVSGSASASGSSPRPHAPLHAAHAAHRDSFHGAMCPALIVAQCFALLPVDGISRNHPGVPQFRWLSFRVFYTVAVFLGTAVVALLATYRMVSSGMSFNSSVTVVFFGNSLSAMVLFLQLATRWPAVARAWARIEHDMRTYGYPRHLGRKIKVMTAVVLALATVEHLLAVMTAVYTSWPCYESGGFTGLVRGYSINNFAMVLQVTEYSPWKAVFVFLLNVLATFSWNYTDLFIMLLSVSLAQRFKQLNHRLRALKGKNLPSGVWRQLRETYNSLACLTRTVDEAVNNIVLLSFASNLYFICVQLLQGMKLILDVYPYVYFFFSFGYLLLRTCVVSLYAASIHDESKEPRRVLYSVPSESFCTEVRRFLAQVTTDDVALTGCNFFSVTRSLMLTVAGTIVTYEIVLVQFQGVSGDGSTDSVAQAANITVRCQ